MDTSKLAEATTKYIKYLENEGFNNNTIWLNQKIIGCFQEYCSSKQIIQIESEVVKEFYNDVFHLNIDNLTTRYQTVLVRPIRALLDYSNDGRIKKRYKKSTELIIKNKDYCELIENFKNLYLNLTVNSDLSKKRKIRVIGNFFNYLSTIQIDDLSSLTTNDVINYVNKINNIYKRKTVECYKSILKEFFRWLYKENYINFTIQNIFSSKKNVGRDIIAEGFSKVEIKKILDSIDISTKSGKHHYLILILLAYYGLRAGDIINLKFENIDFEKNLISITQRKTKVKLILPLIEEVKFALLDYLKNSRPQNIESNFIILTSKAPYTKYSCESNINEIIINIIKKAEIDMKNRKFGSRIFRHSLATNMINDNVALNSISAILGHSSTKSTNVYIQRDMTHLKELTLEVPHE
jgi:integrase